MGPRRSAVAIFFVPEAKLRFVLIDQLLELEPGIRAVASVTFPSTLELFADHFPGKPIVPGVLLTEAMGQTAGWLIAATAGFDCWPLLVMIEQAKFRRFVSPDEKLRLTARMHSARDDRYQVKVDATSDGARVAHASLVFRTFGPSVSGPEREAFATWARQTFHDLGGPHLLRRNAPER